MDKQKLEPCPCGKIPEDLHIEEGETFKRRLISGTCCGEWMIETRVSTMVPQEQRKAVHETECIKAWNTAPRSTPPVPSLEKVDCDGVGDNDGFFELSAPPVPEGMVRVDRDYLQGLISTAQSAGVAADQLERILIAAQQEQSDEHRK